MVPRSPAANGHISQEPLVKDLSMRPPIHARTSSVFHSKWPADSESDSFDPDDLFVRHPVSEVKSVQKRLRADADAKQEELRLMVGERYRDLLQASASIISLARSSVRVKEALGEANAVIQAQKPPAIPNDAAHFGRDSDVHLRTLQLLSAHMKLLLDAPEHLWRLIEKRQYFTAAWLFLLSRVVFRSLVQNDEQDEEAWQAQGIDVVEQFPLVQRQWEAISQFRSQIIHRATMFLREGVMSSEDACAALLTLHLLDSKPLIETFTIFLGQRTKSVRAIIASTHSASSGNGHVPIMSRKRDAIPKPASVGEFKQTLHSILSSFNATIKASKDIYLDRLTQPSLMATVLRRMQSDAPTSQPAPIISSELGLNTQSLLASLPSSTHLLLLPQNLRSYKPYVDLTSSSSSIPHSQVTQKLDAWFSEAREIVASVTTQWLSKILDAQEVWNVRASLHKWIHSSSGFDQNEHEQLVCSFDEIIRRRVLAIWKTSQSDTQLAFKRSVNDAILSVRPNAGSIRLEQDTAEFLFQAPPLPIIHSTSAPIDSFRAYKSRLRQQLESRTALLDEVLASLENCAKSLQRDLAYVQRRADDTSQASIEQLREGHQPEAQTFCHDIVNALESISGLTTDDAAIRVNDVIFIARVADRLSNAISLPIELGCGSETARSFCEKSRMLRDRLVERCREVVVGDIVRDYHISSSQGDPGPVARGASCALFTALLTLQMFNQHLAYGWIRPSVDPMTEWFRSLVMRLLKDVNAIRGLESIVDLAILRKVAESRSEWDDIQLTLTQAINSAQVKHLETSLDAPKFRQTISDHFLRSQTILAPLLHAPSSYLPFGSGEGRDKFAGLLIHGATPADQQFKPAFSIAAPSTRFGLLLVGGAESP